MAENCLPYYVVMSGCTPVVHASHMIIDVVLIPLVMLCDTCCVVKWLLGQVYNQVCVITSCVNCIPMSHLCRCRCSGIHFTWGIWVYDMGGGITKASFISLLKKFLTLPKILVKLFESLHIWQVSSKLSCGDTCQIWMWCWLGPQCFDNSENLWKYWMKEIGLVTPTPGLWPPTHPPTHTHTHTHTTTTTK